MLVLGLWLLPVAAAAQPSSPEVPEDPVEEESGFEAPAEPSRRPTPNIEEIVITGEVLENAVQNDPVSATTFSAKELKALRVQNISDLADYTSNLEINTAFAASNPTLFIRGIGLKDYNANAPGAVGVYRDGINIDPPAIQLGQLFDVERIEVLRGPQGAVNGRNATAGAIHIHTAQPGDEFNFNTSFSYGNYNSIQGEGAIDVPLIPGFLTSRVAFTANFADGHTKNGCANWDPESIGRPRLTEDSIRQAWEDAGRPVQRQFFPTSRDTDAQGRELRPDFVCIHKDGGRLDLRPLRGPNGDPTLDPVWEPNQNPGERTLEDFQGLKRWVNDVANWGARGSLRLTPPPEGLIDGFDEMEWNLKIHGGQNLGDSRRLQMLRSEFRLLAGILCEPAGGFSERKAGEATGLEGAAVIPGFFRCAGQTEAVPGGRGGDDPFVGWYDRDGRELLDNIGGSLVGSWDLGSRGDVGSLLITSRTGYEWYERTVEDEGDATPEVVFPAEWSDGGWQVSQELRVEMEADRLNLALGAFFLHSQVDSFNAFPATQARRTDQTFAQSLYSGAPYASGGYQIQDELRIDLGFRYAIEAKEFELSSSAVPLNDPSAPVRLIPPEVQEKLWQAPTGEATLTWSPTGRLLDAARNETLDVYGKYARGFKGGHFNAGLTLLPQDQIAQLLEPVEPEHIHAIEVGVKSRWLDDRLTLNLAGFRYWYTDLQVFDYFNEVGTLPIQRLLNADAKVLGAELDLNARPVPWFNVKLSAGWLDTEFGEFIVTKAIQGPRGQAAVEVFNYEGHPLISAPEWSLSAVFDLEIPLFGYGFLLPQYDFSYRSKVWLDPQMIEPISQDPYWIHNARLAYRTEDGRIEVAGWVENMLDERYKIDAFDLSIAFNQVLEVWNDPRLFGFTVTYNFD